MSHLVYDKRDAVQAPKIRRLCEFRDRLLSDHGALTTDEAVTLIDLLCDLLGSKITPEIRERYAKIETSEDAASS